MKRYFFYGSSGQGIVVLQYPNTADSFGNEQSPVVYQTKFTEGTSIASIYPGALMDYATMKAAIVAAYSDAAIMVETNMDASFVLVHASGSSI